MELLLPTQTFHCFLFQTCSYFVNISSHSSWTVITPNSEWKSPVFESLTFHWDHGRQYVMHISTLSDSACVQVGLSRVVTLYLSVHWLCPFACCALKCRPEHVVTTVRNRSELHLSECPSLSLFTCSDLLWHNVRTVPPALCQIGMNASSHLKCFLKCRLYCTEALETTYHIRLWTCTFLFVNVLFFLFFSVALCVMHNGVRITTISDIYVKSKW